MVSRLNDYDKIQESKKENFIRKMKEQVDTYEKSIKIKDQYKKIEVEQNTRESIQNEIESKLQGISDFERIKTRYVERKQMRENLLLEIEFKKKQKDILKLSEKELEKSTLEQTLWHLDNRERKRSFH